MVLQMKQAWRIYSEPNLLVSKFLKGVYFVSDNLLEASIGQRPSYVWGGLMRSQSAQNQHLLWLKLGNFTVKDTYKFLMEGIKHSHSEGESSNSNETRKFWRIIWRLAVPNKVKFFAWRMFHNAVPDAFNLKKRNCEATLSCLECNYKVESVLHVVKECWKARAVWRSLGYEEETLRTSFDSPSDWLWNCTHAMNLDKFQTLIIGCWYLWYVRNKLRFNNEATDANLIYARIRTLVCNGKNV